MEVKKISENLKEIDFKIMKKEDYKKPEPKILEPIRNRDYLLIKIYKCCYCDHTEEFTMDIEKHIRDNHISELQKVTD